MGTLSVHVGGKVMLAENCPQRSRDRFDAAIDRLTIAGRSDFSKVSVTLHDKESIDHGLPHL